MLFNIGPLTRWKWILITFKINEVGYQIGTYISRFFIDDRDNSSSLPFPCLWTNIKRFSSYFEVLLISGGECLEPEERVCKYSAGSSDSNPIFLYSVSSLESSVPPVSVDSHFERCVRKSLKPVLRTRIGFIADPGQHYAISDPDSVPDPVLDPEFWLLMTKIFKNVKLIFV